METNYEESKASTPNHSPVNRMDTPESNCSDTNIDQETTKLWQALAKWVTNFESSSKRISSTSEK